MMRGGRGVWQKVMFYDKGGLGVDKKFFSPTKTDILFLNHFKRYYKTKMSLLNLFFNKSEGSIDLKIIFASCYGDGG